MNRGRKDLRVVQLWRGETEYDAVDIKNIFADFGWQKRPELERKMEHLKELYNDMIIGKGLPRDDAKFMAAYDDVRMEFRRMAWVYDSMELPVHRWLKARYEVYFGRAKILADGSIVELNADGSIKRVPAGG